MLDKPCFRLYSSIQLCLCVHNQAPLSHQSNVSICFLECPFTVSHIRMFSPSEHFFPLSSLVFTLHYLHSNRQTPSNINVFLKSTSWWCTALSVSSIRRAMMRKNLTALWETPPHSSIMITNKHGRLSYKILWYIWMIKNRHCWARFHLSIEMLLEVWQGAF